jgi:hypothetical protein
MDEEYERMTLGELHERWESGDPEDRAAILRLREKQAQWEQEQEAVQERQQRELDALKRAAARSAWIKDRREWAMLALTAVACIAAVVAVLR